MKYHYTIVFQEVKYPTAMFITEGEFNKLTNVVSFTRMTRDELAKALRENVDHEEMKRRNIFSRQAHRNNTQDNADKVYLRSGYDATSPTIKVR
tara:strand:+ start:1805 stop:2086 length:282 start_codon:yes stop_codon:yes gene_type:complete